MEATQVGGDVTQVLVTKEQLAARITELAAEIDRDYAGKELLLVGVLNGAVMVMADLSRALTIHCRMDWMAVSSYGSGTKSSGVVQILKDLGVRSMRLLSNNPRKLVGIEGYQLTVREWIPLEIPASDSTRRYLTTKKNKLGHKLTSV